MRQFIYGILVFLYAQSALAAGNAAPFGVEVGVATLTQVQKDIGGKSPLRETGINKFTTGRMIETAGEGLGVDGVQSVLFIFDKADVLAGVVVTMDKDPRGLYKTLSSKYKPVTNKIDQFMNNGYARLEKGGSFIEIDAPHMSFTMDVRYVTKALMAAYNQTQSSEKAAKQQKKANAL